MIQLYYTIYHERMIFVKKILSVIVVFAMLISGITVTYADGVEKTKVIYRIAEENENVGVSVVLKGEAEKIMGMTFYIGYDKDVLEPITESFELNDKFKDWLMPNEIFTIADGKSGKNVNFWISAADKENLYFDMAENEELEIANFEFKKLGTLTENSISNDVFYNFRDKALMTTVQALPDKQLLTLNNRIMPENFIIEYVGDGLEQSGKIEITDKDECDTMAVGKTKQLTAIISSSGMNADQIKWSAQGGVSVSDTGLVTAEKVGKASVTASINDIKSTYEINVVEQEVLPQSIEIIGATKCSTGEIYEYSAKVLPENATNKSVYWSVDGIISADINAKTGVLLANASGDVNVKAVSRANTEVSATLPISISKAVPDNYDAKAASLMINDTLYANSLSWDGESKYKLVLSAFNIRGTKLPNMWKEYYTIEYKDNFGGIKGIKRDGDFVIVSKDAADADNLEVTAEIISKIDGSTVCTAKTQPFKVVSALNVTDVKFEGADVIKEENGVYNLKLTSDKMSFKASANRTPYISYSLNGGDIKCSDVNISKSELKDGKNQLVIYIHGDERPGAAGYKLNSLAKTVIAEIEK